MLHLPYEWLTWIVLVVGFLGLLTGLPNFAAFCASAAVAFAIIETGYRMSEGKYSDRY